MKAWFAITLLFAAIAFTGCVASVQETGGIGSRPENAAVQNNYTAYPAQENLGQENAVQDVYDAPPSITERSVISNPTAGSQFPLSITAQDDKGIVELRWQSSKLFQGGQSGSFNCNMEKTCSNTWNLIAIEEGPQQITVSVVDISGKQSQASLEIDVRQARAVSTEPVVNNTSTPMIQETNQSQEPVLDDDSCDSDSDCGYKEICTGGVCEAVQCTSDSHCSGCKRCSSNRCVSCGSGPYGCYC